MHAHKIPADNINAQAIANIARQWLGTPYIANGQIKGVGCDCAGLIIGVLHELDFAENLRKIGLESAFAKYALKIEKPQIGDFLLFKSNGIEQYHLGILLENNQFIHAHINHGVILNTFGNFFTRHLLAAYRFKE